MKLQERLRQLRVTLKSGDYDGADLMQAWCAMIDAADKLDLYEAALREVRQREAAVADDEHMACGIRNYSMRSVEIIDAALNSTDTGA